MHGHASASLRLRELADVFYKTAPDQPHIRDGVMGGATRAGGNPRHTGADRSTTRWMRVVLVASIQIITGMGWYRSADQH